MVSAATRMGVKELEYKIYDINKNIPDVVLDEKRTHLIQNENPTKVWVEDGVFHVSGDKVEYYFRSTDFSEPDSVRRFDLFLEREGINEELQNLGIEDGDTVDILGYEFSHME